MKKKSHIDDHNQLPSDEATRNKINKHLSDIDDTISEDDLKNINTVTGTENVAKEPVEKNPGKKKRSRNRNEEPEKEAPEAPTPWEILGE